MKQDIKQRIESFAASNYAGLYTRLDIRFRKQFCYIDAYQEPQIPDDYPPEGFPETREEYIERLRNTPIHLCRLRYFSDDRWGFAFYTYSGMKYELSVYPNGEFFGKPEEAFAASAMYLQ